MGVIGGDYSKLRVDSLLFFVVRLRVLGICHFHFFRVVEAPTTTTTSDHPLPPVGKSASYPQATVDSVDNYCKLLILLDFLPMLTNRLQNRFNTMSIMLTQNIRKAYTQPQTVTRNETKLADCGQLASRSVDNLWITFIFRILKSIFWAMLGGERSGWCIIGVHCHRNAVWITLLLSALMITISHYQISYQSYAKDSDSNTSRRP